MKMRMTVLFLMASFFCFGAEVIKISKNKMDMAITHDLGKNWVVGQEICVNPSNGKQICGRVVKVKKAGAICKMNEPLDGVDAGADVFAQEGLGGDDEPIEDPLESGGRLEDPEESPKITKKKRDDRGTSLGLRGGLALANISFDPSVDTTNRTGFDFGLFFDFPLGKSAFSLEPGLSFVQRGYQLEGSSFLQKANYIDFRLLFKATLVRGPFSPILYAGPYTGLLLSAAYVLSSSADEIDNKDSYQSIDFGVLGGLGGEITLSKKVSLQLVGFYGLGLSNIFNVGTTSTGKNRTLHFLGSLSFQI